MERPEKIQAQLSTAVSEPFVLKHLNYEVERLKNSNNYLNQTLVLTNSGKYDKTDHSLLNWTLHDKSSPMPSKFQPIEMVKTLPKWIEYENKVLQFFCYVPESNKETKNDIIRYCIFKYYLEDDTIQIFEPTIDNSGLKQGMLLKRHKYQIPNTDRILNFTDIQFGKYVELYTKRYYVIDCDAYTKNFCEKMGHNLGSPQTCPDGSTFLSHIESKHQYKHPSYDENIRKEIQQTHQYREALLGGAPQNKLLKQYLENDGNVLRFYCYWNDTSLYGVRTYYILHYFLRDNTTEIMINSIPNSGTSHFTVFLRKQPLPKSVNTISPPGIEQLLNEIYMPQDLIVGESISVYNRDFYLYDCDEFTRNFYRNKFNIEQKSEEITVPTKDSPAVQYPPHALGIGSDDDTLASCLNIVPKRPVNNERQMLFGDNRIYQYHAILYNPSECDKGREFRISRKSIDNSIMVYELRNGNSGHMGGKFSDWSLCINPNTNSPYTDEDLRIESIITINSRKFIITKELSF